MKKAVLSCWRVCARGCAMARLVSAVRVIFRLLSQDECSICILARAGTTAHVTVCALTASGGDAARWVVNGLSHAMPFSRDILQCITGFARLTSDVTSAPLTHTLIQLARIETGTKTKTATSYLLPGLYGAIAAIVGTDGIRGETPPKLARLPGTMPGRVISGTIQKIQNGTTSWRQN